jgi:hypothetical protein
VEESLRFCDVLETQIFLLQVGTFAWQNTSSGELSSKNIAMKKGHFMV